MKIVLFLILVMAVFSVAYYAVTGSAAGLVGFTVGTGMSVLIALIRMWMEG